MESTGTGARLSPREQKIVEMLLLRSDVILGSESGKGRDGSYSLGYGNMFGQAFRELERLLDVMRDVRPKQRRHVIARYVDCERRPIDVPFTRRKVHGQPRFEFRLPPHCELAIEVSAPSVLDDRTARVLVYRWPAWVRGQAVRAGVGWLAESFRGVPGVPKELQEAA